MPNAESLAALAQMKLAETVDLARPAGDHFKLPAPLRAQLDADFTALDAADADTALTESDRAGGSGAARDALSKLAELARDGYNFITAIRATKITEAQRNEVFAAYGWVGGNLGRFGDSRVIGLARLAVKDHAALAPEHRYAADLVADITTALKAFDDHAVAATGGDRSAATKTRNDALALANVTLAQVRFAYCAASRDTDQTPELTKIGFQPRRAAGTVSHAKPAAAAVGTPPVK